jgi:hypothetical protein
MYKLLAPFALVALLAPAALAVPTPLGEEAMPFIDAVAGVKPKATLPATVAQVAHAFVGRPYLEASLEALPSRVGAPEPLICRLDAFDCVTLVENSVAIARAVSLATPASYSTYRAQLESLRYRGGVRGDYSTRLHYFSDWVADNERRGNVKDLTPSLGGQADRRPITFMTAHRGSYRKLGDDQTFKEIQAVEASLARTPRYVLPNAKVAGILPLLQSGDIIAFATDIEGLDVVHTGLIYRQPNGAVHLLHAPEPGQKVTVSTKPLVEYLTLFPRHVGVIIARPLPPKKG